MHLSTDPQRQEVSSGANEAFNANVFIDGQSYKNDVLLGGVVGQDASKGNPFPQSAVQEFRVITQNFKAEYEKSSSNVITAVPARSSIGARATSSIPATRSPTTRGGRPAFRSAARS
jgi:hypothetical protein